MRYTEHRAGQATLLLPLQKMTAYRRFQKGISLPGVELRTELIQAAVLETNATMAALAQRSANLGAKITDLLDLRTLSGLMGEALATTLAKHCPLLRRNPHIDGYPDLLNLSSPQASTLFSEGTRESFILFPFGGIEVKNTCGIRKSGDLLPGQTRIGSIQRPKWKAHHRNTNNLLATYTDFLDGLPVIAAVMYSDRLAEGDWSMKHQPKAGSAMTSFCELTNTGYAKLREGLLLCLDSDTYLTFFVEATP
jgi:hypothetical protein